MSPTIALLLAALAAPPASSDVEDPTPEAPRDPWLQRWPAERNIGTLDVFGGLMVMRPQLELFEPDPAAVDQGYVPLRSVAPEIGARVGFFPGRVVGLELEGSLMPTRTTTRRSALVWAVRGNVLLQLPTYSLTPFAVVGPSLLGVASGEGAVGHDQDFGVHFGVGLRAQLNRHLGLRLDIRDTLTSRRGLDAGFAHTPEVLLSVSVSLGRSPSLTPLPTSGRTRDDVDGDGVPNEVDACPSVGGYEQYRGCLDDPLGDRDGDGVVDAEDLCVDTPGEPDIGCPYIHEAYDMDGDGIDNESDRCPSIAGLSQYQGCPDTDGDGIHDLDDECADQSENYNGFADDDGCPDQRPFVLPIKPLFFDDVSFERGRHRIGAESYPVLDDAVEKLESFTEVRLEIRGHTDSAGREEDNLRISLERAQAVKDYLVEHGIEPERLEVRGVGSTQPIARNDTDRGRAANRRVELRIVSASDRR